MISPRITGLVRFLIGILLLQTATALLTYIALTTESGETIWLFVALAALLGLTVAFWFDSVVTAVRERTMARQHERHTREREKIQVRAEREREKLRAQAERERTKLSVQNHKQQAKSGSGLRAGVTLGGVVGVGIAMMMTQFMTLGLLTVAAASGAALGYSARTRQEKRIRAREAGSAERLIVDQGAVTRLESTSEEPKPRRRFKRNQPV